MKKLLKQLWIVCLLLPTVVFSEAQEDAQFIAEQGLFTQDYNAKVTEINNDITTLLANGFVDVNAELIDPDAFFEQLFGAFLETLPERITEISAKALLEYLSDDEITKLAAFYRSPSGKVFLEKAKNLEFMPIREIAFYLTVGWPLLKERSNLRLNIQEELWNEEPPIDLGVFADLVNNPSMVRFENEEDRASIVEAFKEIARK